MTVKIKKMRFITIKIKIPQPNYDELTRLVNRRNADKEQSQHVDDAYIVSELVMKHTQPVSE